MSKIQASITRGLTGVFNDRTVKLDHPIPLQSGKYIVYRATKRTLNGQVMARVIEYTPTQNFARHKCHLAINPEKSNFWACHGMVILEGLQKIEAEEREASFKAKEKAARTKADAKKKKEKETE
jgi:hypothetical protein